MKRIFNDVYFYFVLVIILTFIIIKIPQLSLPYFWDEAFGHTAAIHHMLVNGLSILPKAIPPELSTGHPILFHFMEALWMKIFGSSLAAAKSYPLLLSVLLLFSIYFFCKKFFNRLTGIVVVIIFASQEIFIAQSSFVLLEVQLTLLTITTFYLFFSEYKILYVISALMLMLTKETGLILPILLLLFKLIDTKFRIFKLQYFWLILPLLITFVYFIIQKFTYGWFFYPKHISSLSFNLKTVWFNLNSVYFKGLFLEYGRNIMTLFFVISIVFYLFKKYKPEQTQLKVIISFILFIILFLMFSIINIVSNRYILCLYPVYIILCAYVILAAFREYKPIALTILCLVVFVKLYYTYTERKDGDCNLGYIDCVLVHKSVVSYCEQNKLQDKNIFTTFLIQQDLRDPHIGYLSDKNKPFIHGFYNNADFNNADYCIFSSTNYDPVYDKFKKQYNLRLLNRFEKNNSWAEIYQISH